MKRRRRRFYYPSSNWPLLLQESLLSPTLSGNNVSGVWAETQAYAAHLHNFTKSFIYKI
jgi:hypothetical protein